MTDVGNKTSFAPQVVPLTRHVLVDRKIIHETLTAAEIGKEYGNDIHIIAVISSLRRNLNNAQFGLTLSNILCKGDKKWLKLCLNNENALNAVGSEGESALHRAVANEQANILDSSDRNAIHWLSVRQIPKTKLSLKQRKLITLLIDGGCSLCQRDKFGATPMHYAAMKGNWPLCELFAQHDNRLLLQKDIFDMTPRDRAVLWNKRSTSRRMRHAESEYNLSRSIIEHSKLLKLKLDAIKSLRHDVGYFSDVAFKGFLAEKEIVDGYYSNTLHEDELANGLRQRLRVTGPISDRSLGIEKIVAQQDKRRKHKPPLRISDRKPVCFGPTPTMTPRARYLTEDFSKPLSSKAELPVQIVIEKDGSASLKRQLLDLDGRIYHDSNLPKLAGEIIQKECGETVLFRMKEGSEVNHFKPSHIDDNKKCRTFTENYSTEVQYHVKHTFP